LVPLIVAVMVIGHVPVHSLRHESVSEQDTRQPGGRFEGAGFWVGGTFGNCSGGIDIGTSIVAQLFGDMAPVLTEVCVVTQDGEMVIVPSPASVPLLQTTILSVPLKPWDSVQVNEFVGDIPIWLI
jgi:hypothetical protein